MALWVDRHLHKNGGSTVREVMLRNEEAGNCVYYGYTQTHEGWVRLMKELGRIGVRNGSEPLPRLCVEAHASQASAEFVSRRIPDLLALRSHFARLSVPVRVVLTTRVREPLSYYISFYRWRVAGMQRHGGVIRLSSTRSVVQPLGTTFLDWAPPNLQSIGLLHGDVELFAGLKAGGWPGVRNATQGRRPHPYWVQHQRFGREDYRELLESLRHYDVVAPLEAFDEHLLLISAATGFPPLSSEEHKAVVPDPQGMHGVRLKDHDVCPDLVACRAHIARIAPWDVKLHRQVSAAFAERVGGLGVSFRRRVEQLRARRAKGDVGVCAGEPATGGTCCCTERLPCFNMTGRERRLRAPPACVPGTRKVQELVASDMPLGWCCTNRRLRGAASRRERRKAEREARGRWTGRRIQDVED